MARVVNSRIRLLLLCIFLAFGGLLARASWIATVRASSLSAKAQVQTKAPVVLAGVVALNVAVLRVNMQVSRLDREQIELQAQNAALASNVSSAASAQRIEQAAHKLGYVPAPATDTSYLELGK